MDWLMEAAASGHLASALGSVVGGAIGGMGGRVLLARLQKRVRDLETAVELRDAEDGRESTLARVRDLAAQRA